MTDKIPYLMHADALTLKALAENAVSPNPEMGDPSIPPEKRQVCVSAFALLSLIEQAHSPQMGLATTRELREELTSREGCAISRQDHYRTFDPNEAH